MYINIYIYITKAEDKGACVDAHTTTTTTFTTTRHTERPYCFKQGELPNCSKSPLFQKRTRGRERPPPTSPYFFGQIKIAILEF